MGKSYLEMAGSVSLGSLKEEGMKAFKPWPLLRERRASCPCPLGRGCLPGWLVGGQHWWPGCCPRPSRLRTPHLHAGFPASTGTARSPPWLLPEGRGCGWLCWRWKGLWEAWQGEEVKHTAKIIASLCTCSVHHTFKTGTGPNKYLLLATAFFFLSENSVHS